MARHVPVRWWNCGICGGVSVPVRIRHDAGAGAYNPGADNPGTYSRETSGEGCPRCETRRRRLEAPGGGITVWYDTLLRDWVVRLPVVRFGMDAILPLEFGWFDVPWVDVYRAAADLAFAEEVFELREIEAAEEAEDF